VCVHDLRAPCQASSPVEHLVHWLLAPCTCRHRRYRQPQFPSAQLLQCGVLRRQADNAHEVAAVGLVCPPTPLLMLSTGSRVVNLKGSSAHPTLSCSASICWCAPDSSFFSSSRSASSASHSAGVGPPKHVFM
jgi:hypothetical protein